MPIQPSVTLSTRDSLILREEVEKRATANGMSAAKARQTRVTVPKTSAKPTNCCRTRSVGGGRRLLLRSVEAACPAGQPGDTKLSMRLPATSKTARSMAAIGGMGGGRSVNRLVERGRDGALKVSVQNVADRTFFRTKDDLWQDQSYDDKKNKLTAIKAFSDAHFALLRAVPEMGIYSSVGEDAIIRVGRNAVRIGKTGRESLTSSEVKELVAK